MVQAICNLELACYKAIPELKDIKQALGKVRMLVNDTIREDEDLSESFDDFYSIINDANDVYVKLKVMQEVPR